MAPREGLRTLVPEWFDENCQERFSDSDRWRECAPAMDGKGAYPALSAINGNAPLVGAFLFMARGGTKNPRLEGSTKRQDSRFAQLRCPKGEAQGRAECNPSLTIYSIASLRANGDTPHFAAK